METRHFLILILHNFFYFIISLYQVRQGFLFFPHFYFFLLMVAVYSEEKNCHAGQYCTICQRAQQIHNFVKYNATFMWRVFRPSYTLENFKILMSQPPSSTVGTSPRVRPHIHTHVCVSSTSSSKLKHCFIFLKIDNSLKLLIPFMLSSLVCHSIWVTHVHMLTTITRDVRTRYEYKKK